MDYKINNITIIIILYEEDSSIVFRCLNNIKNFKIIIVDNAGNINLKKKVEENYKIFKYILNNKNYGVSKGFNQAIYYCETEYFLTLQADCIISTKDILLLLDTHEKYKDCFITSPTFYDKDLVLSYNGGCLPENTKEIEILNLEGDTCVETVSTAAILMKKKDIIKLGMFDEIFFIYFLDFEICRRILALKKSVIQVFLAKNQHVHGDLKVKNIMKKTFIRNYYFTLDELCYFFKVNKHHSIFLKLKKKIPNYIIKSITSIFLLKPSKCIYYFARVMAFYKFKKIIKNK